jgi:hypothetical protein
LVLLVALSGRILINLIVSFYSVYIAGVLIPLVAFIWEDQRGFAVPSNSVYLALTFGGGIATTLLVLSRLFVHFVPAGSDELVILSGGLVGSFTGFLIGKVRAKER